MGCNCSKCLFFIWWSLQGSAPDLLLWLWGQHPTPLQGMGQASPETKLLLLDATTKYSQCEAFSFCFLPFMQCSACCSVSFSSLGQNSRKNLIKSLNHPTGRDVHLGNNYKARKWEHYSWVTLLFNYSNIRNRNLIFSPGHQELKLQRAHELISQVVLTPPRRTRRGRLNVQAVTRSFALAAQLLAK